MKVIIIGAYGTALNIADSITQAAKSFGTGDEVLGFAIDNQELGDNIGGYPILCLPRELTSKFSGLSDVKIIFALYKPALMRERSELLASYGIPREMFCTFIHPSTYLAPGVRIGVGNAILSNCSIQSRVVIGDYNIINSNVIIEHDTKIDSNNFIAAGACVGSLVEIKTGTFIGLNSAVREHVTIDNYSLVGMCSNVLTDVHEADTVFGNPAKVKHPNI